MSINRLIKNSKLDYDNEKVVYAHYKNKSEKETYSLHIKKTVYIFKKFLNNNEKIIRILFQKIKDEFNLSFPFQRFKNYLKDIARLHDIGKCNPLFQRERLGISDYPQRLKGFKKEEISRDHSYPSAWLSLPFLMRKYDIGENPVLFIFPYLIWGHHTSLKNTYDNYFSFPNFDEGKYETTVKYLLKILNIEITSKELKGLRKNASLLKNELNGIPNKKGSGSLSILYNLLYSFLINSDTLASVYAYEKLDKVKSELKKPINDRIDQKTFKKMKNSFKAKQEEYKKMKDKKINKIRQEMFEESLKNLDKGLKENRRVFYLKMPTGGGKTNTSMGLALKILDKTKTNRIIYSLPYTCIIDQNYGVIKETLNLEEPSEIRKIYSGAESIFEDTENQQILLDDDFYNYPVICTTHVSLFNPIIKFKKSLKAKFQSLGNSIVILDEVQSLPSKYWGTLNYLINELARNLNIYFIIMSATVPNLDELISFRGKKPPYKDDVFYLLESPNKYFKKFKRNKIITNKPKEYNLESQESRNDLKEFLKNKIKRNFENGFKKGLIVLNTVRTSLEIYNLIKNEIKDGLGEDFKTSLLNSTFLPTKKKEIIGELDQLEKSKESRKYILVSTQSIEAGMDVDFDFVIRDFATLDSIEQIRGRCNREMERNFGKIYLIKLKRDSFKEWNIYNKSKLSSTSKILKKNMNYDYRGIEKYYDELIKKLNKRMEKTNQVTNLDNIDYFNKMKYEGKNVGRAFELDIIEKKFNNYTLFVERKIPIKKSFSGGEKPVRYFSEDEISYLKRKDKEEGLELIKGGHVDGRNILKYYKKKKSELKQEGDYVEKKMSDKKFGSILQKFMFQLVTTMKETTIRERLELGEKIGYFWVLNQDQVGEREDHYYSLEKGFKKQKLREKMSPEQLII